MVLAGESYSESPGRLDHSILSALNKLGPMIGEYTRSCRTLDCCVTESKYKLCAGRWNALLDVSEPIRIGIGRGALERATLGQNRG